MPEKNVGATRGDEVREMLASGARADFLFATWNVSAEHWSLIHDDALGPIGIELFDLQKMREDFTDGPAALRGHPIEDFFGDVLEQ